MTELVEIQGTGIYMKEYNGHRVVTFKDIDAVHKRPEGTARKRFNENRQRFISGADFFVRNPDEAASEYGIIAPNGLKLITESGYLMLVKSFTDDLAWTVQRDLVNTYFRVREEVIEQSVTVTETVPMEEHEVYLEAARIMASVPNSQRYVINCLRHVVSDIDSPEEHKIVTEIKSSVPAGQGTRKHPRYIKEGVDIDKSKLLVEIGSQGVSFEALAKKANVSVTSISGWVAGKHRPVLQNRTNLCIALGKDKDFLTPRRTRNIKE